MLPLSGSTTHFVTIRHILSRRWHIHEHELFMPRSFMHKTFLTTGWVRTLSRAEWWQSELRYGGGYPLILQFSLTLTVTTNPKYAAELKTKHFPQFLNLWTWQCKDTLIFSQIYYRCWPEHSYILFVIGNVFGKKSHCKTWLKHRRGMKCCQLGQCLSAPYLEKLLHITLRTQFNLLQVDFPLDEMQNSRVSIPHSKTKEKITLKGLNVVKIPKW